MNRSHTEDPRYLGNERSVTVPLSQELFDALHAAKDAVGVSLSSFIRGVLAQAVDEMDVHPERLAQRRAQRPTKTPNRRQK